ncbi:MAG TPA: hypothetical protein VFE05_10470 [Longimicrobiaceae bacterium]|jgi:hypothetical protein|nr:hypothetical protein [Longimicrobiaceae bacterium]
MAASSTLGDAAIAFSVDARRRDRGECSAAKVSFATPLLGDRHNGAVCMTARHVQQILHDAAYPGFSRFSSSVVVLIGDWRIA